MGTAPLEQAIASTHVVLTNVSPQQLDGPTPCANWTVRELINHIVGGQYFFAAGAAGQPLAGDGTDFSAGDFVAAFDEGAAACVIAFNTDGVMTKTLKLPFGEMPGAAFLGLAATDTFTHGWDLAKATGQDTDLAPELAGALLQGARTLIPEAFRSSDGAVFGAEQPAPEGSSAADQLAAFLGRTV